MQVVAIRDAHQNRVPTPSTILGANDVLLVVGIDAGQIRSGRSSAKGPRRQRSSPTEPISDYVRVYASTRSVVGMPLGSLKMPGFDYTYVQVRRG